MRDISVIPAKAGIHNHRSSRSCEIVSMAGVGTYYVYILASGRNGTLYIGVTNNIRVRLEQHRTGRGSEFVKKYGVHRLVHVETFPSAREAIARENS
jgi:predicted GIY-YIG superfamily endonuclease